MPRNSRRRCRTVLAPLVAAILVVATGCAGPTSGAASDGTVRIGLLANLTGDAATSFGIPFQHGLELALEDAKGALDGAGLATELVTEDAQSTVPAAVTGYNRLKQEGVPVVLNDSQSPLGQAVAPLANDDKITFLSGAGSELENSHGFAFRFTDLSTPTAAMGEYLLEQGAERVGVVVASDNPSFATLADVTEKALPHGYASRQEVSSSETNFATVLANLRTDNVDAVVLSVLPAQAGNLILQMRHSGGFDEVLLAGTVAISSETYTVAKDAASGFVFPQVWAPGTPRGAGFEKRYEEAYGDTPTAYGALGYQAGWIVLAALIEASRAGDISGTAVRDALPAASTSDLVSEHGILDLDLELKVEGSAVSPGVMTRFTRDGTMRVVGG